MPAKNKRGVETDYRREFLFTPGDFESLRQWIKTQAGINLSPSKEDLVYARLAKRLRATGLDSFQAYRQLVEQSPAEQVQLINAITTNLTAFFREQHHFEHLQQVVIPELVRLKGKQRSLRIWSAGCSSGEEPYSIAMAVLEALPDPDSWDVKILATDLDSNVLAKAAEGVYSQERLQGFPLQRLQRWMKKGIGAKARLARVHPQLQARIRFRQLNLMDAWPMQGVFDVIFCRNVVIYFDKPTQRRLFDRYANQLVEGGWLYIGHSESLHTVSDRFQLRGKTIYQKVR